MGDFKWSFLNRIVECVPNKRLVGEIRFPLALIEELNLACDSGAVPEGLLIECCAQGAGLAMMLGEEVISFLPVLARVNTCEFIHPLPLETSARVESELLYQNENNAAEFDCVIRLMDVEDPVFRCRLLLGLTTLTDLPDSGAGILEHFEGLKRSFIDS